MTKRTNKEVLGKGIRFLAAALLFIFTGPSILYSAFHNKEHPLYIAVLILGIVVCGVAIFLVFKGISTLMKALFD
ncbi:hypothetical protein SAMN04488096_106139 [Mesonia phycicola]|uniref:Uncharacterized protein n=2 Tax=Mesonia phycicola TaxID=579105 RepID=A0A1M6FH71_9FLAO|nr:hypothetical protein SAMN04488096_106139 [Mesonia phycicola]